MTGRCVRPPEDREAAETELPPTEETETEEAEGETEEAKETETETEEAEGETEETELPATDETETEAEETEPPSSESADAPVTEAAPRGFGTEGTLSTQDTAGVTPVALSSKSFVVLTPQSDFGIEFAGGFTVSGLTDPLFGVVSDSLAGEGRQIIRELDKEDEASLGIAAFIQVFHERHDWFAVTFGLGLRE